MSESLCDLEENTCRAWWMFFNWAYRYLCVYLNGIWMVFEWLFKWICSVRSCQVAFPDESQILFSFYHSLSLFGSVFGQFSVSFVLSLSNHSNSYTYILAHIPTSPLSSQIVPFAAVYWSSSFLSLPYVMDLGVHHYYTELYHHHAELHRHHKEL